MDIYEVMAVSVMTELVTKIVEEKGGFREKDILFDNSNHFVLGTWNDEHKVVNIISNFEDDDGHCDGFSVDLVTGRICG